MKMFSKFGAVLLTSLIFLGLSACHKEEKNVVRVGTISGPETQLVDAAKKVAKEQYGLKIQVIPFSDYSMPNRALNDGSIDANAFQTIAYFNADMAIHKYKLSIVGKTFIYPMAIYSQKIKSLNEIPNGAIVAVPNDPSNEARAILLLQSAGLIKIKDNPSQFITEVDITENPKNLQIKPLDAAQLPRVLPDVTLAVINTNYAIPAGLYPTKDALFTEKQDSPYANVIVIRTRDVNNEKYKNLVAAMHSDAVLQAAKKLFADQAIPAWDVK